MLVHSRLNLRQTCSATSPSSKRRRIQSEQSLRRPASPELRRSDDRRGARIWVQPWLNFSVIEGVSYNTNVGLYEKTFRENYTQLLNYLAFESGSCGVLQPVNRWSNSPSFRGLRTLRVSEGAMATCSASAIAGGGTSPTGKNCDASSAECEDPDRERRVKPSSLSDRLDSIALGDGGEPQRQVSNRSSSTQNQSPQPSSRPCGLGSTKSTNLERQPSKAASNNGAEFPLNNHKRRSWIHWAPRFRQPRPSTGRRHD